MQTPSSTREDTPRQAPGLRSRSSIVRLLCAAMILIVIVAAVAWMAAWRG